MTKHIIFPTIFFLLVWGAPRAQNTEVPFESEQWVLGNANTVLEKYQGESSLKLSGGSIHLSGVAFHNGVIEVDVNFPAERNFFGILFRMQDNNNYEHFYLRPHQSGYPDACQYTPQFNGFSAWQLYHGEGFGTTVDLVPDQWHHLKIEVTGSSARVYYNDMDKAFLEIPNLKGNFSAGSIGLNSGQPVHFANFTYRPDERTYPDSNPEIESTPEMITSWQLSAAISNELFTDPAQLPDKVFPALNWKTRPTESGGLLNIARHVVSTDGKTTVVAKLEVSAERAETRGLLFGYSDEVLVFVNGKLQYAGQNNYRSRDYRYLGTIGFFDAVFLDLQAGTNEVLFVIKENFGGWGLQARWM